VAERLRAPVIALWLGAELAFFWFSRAEVPGPALAWALAAALLAELLAARLAFPFHLIALGLPGGPGPATLLASLHRDRKAWLPIAAAAAARLLTPHPLAAFGAFLAVAAALERPDRTRACLAAITVPLYFVPPPALLAALPLLILAKPQHDVEDIRMQVAVTRLGRDRARVERARTQQELEKTAEQLALLEELTRSLARGPSRADLLMRLVDTARAWSGCRTARVFPLNECWTEALPNEVWQTQTAVVRGHEIALPLEDYGVLYLGDAAQPIGADTAHMLRVLAAQASLGLRCVRYFEEVRASEAQLLQSSKLAAVGQLAAGVAHELNSPLGAIVMGLDAAVDSLERNPQSARDRLENAQNAAQRAREIVSRLLFYSREGKHQDLPCDLNEVVADTLEMLRHPLGVAVQFSPGPPAPVKGSPNQLQQVITNLLINARDAVESQPERQVSVRVQGGDPCRIEVKDNGPGIGADVLAKIFDPFFTTKAPGKGTGLGLSVSHQIVAHHGGTLTVRSQPGEGSVFTVSLPRRHG